MRLRPKRSIPLLLAAALLANGAAKADRMLASIDLSAPFGTRAPWRFTASQGPDIADPIMEDSSTAPGAIALCISKDAARSCRPDLQQALGPPEPEHLFDQPHFLNFARIVHPRADRALLVVQIASLHSVNGNQRVATQVVGYDRTRDAFIRLYANQTGRNNNQETRYIERGPLRGAIISAEPTGDAPFGFWITVSRLAPDDRYRQALRYRSATHYGDGNPLAVIDSEMPNILQRVGLWKPGLPLPLPGGHCARPHMIKRELWCE